MKKYHETKNGEKMLIAKMDDTHLINTIKVYAAKIEQSLAMIDKYSTLKESEKILYGFEYNNKDLTKEATQLIQSSTDGLAAYVFEASIRNLNVSQYLQKAFSRTSKIEKFNSQPILLEIDEDFNEPVIV
jgi:hypothetical protein